MNYARNTDAPPVVCHHCGATFTSSDPQAADAYLAAHETHRAACDHFRSASGRPWCDTCGRRRHYHPDPVQGPAGGPPPPPAGSCTVAGFPPAPTAAGPGTSPPGPAS